MTEWNLNCGGDGKAFIQFVFETEGYKSECNVIIMIRVIIFYKSKQVFITKLNVLFFQFVSLDTKCEAPSIVPFACEEEENM